MGAPAKNRAASMQDSEATLRQVEGVLSDFQGGAGHGAADDGALARQKVIDVLTQIGDRPAGLRDLVEILEAAYGEVMAIVSSLRESRGLLEKQAMERLSSTHQRLAEVSSATEMAATGMLDGLDRSLVLVDHLEDMDAAPATEGDDAQSPSQVRDELRDELHGLIGLLQFQDITSQQLGYATGVLKDIEERMLRIAQIFDLTGGGGDSGSSDTPVIDLAPSSDDAMHELLARQEHDGKGRHHDVCDPAASNFDADSRQALADEIFK